MAVVDQEADWRRAGLVYLVCFVCLVDFAHPVSFVQLKN